MKSILIGQRTHILSGYDITQYEVASAGPLDTRHPGYKTRESYPLFAIGKAPIDMIAYLYRISL